MQATTAQTIQNERAVATGLLAAIFTAGLALGAVAGIAMAPKAAPLVNAQAAEDVYAGPYLGRGAVNVPAVTSPAKADAARLQRQGEISLGVAPKAATGDRLQRQGELSAGSATTLQRQGESNVDPSPSESKALRALRRDEFGGSTSVNDSGSLTPRYEAPRGK